MATAAAATGETGTAAVGQLRCGLTSLKCWEDEAAARMTKCEARLAVHTVRRAGSRRSFVDKKRIRVSRRWLVVGPGRRSSHGVPRCWRCWEALECNF